MDNMRFYEASRTPPKEALKSFSNGKFSGTDISPMWRIRKLTEMFGPAGIGWYIEPVSFRSEEHGDTVMAIAEINLFIKVDGEWSKPIFGTGGNQLKRMTKSGASVSDEGYKMAYTDAISVACKALGIGADIYSGGTDKESKYAQYYTDAQEQPTETREQGNAQKQQQPTETREQVAERKMAEADKKLEQAKASAKRPRTEQQLLWIMENASDEMILNAQNAFGDRLETMTEGQANNMIRRVKAENGEVD